MITYEDIIRVINSSSITELEKDYTNRQVVNMLDNSFVIKEILAYFPDEMVFLPKGLDNQGKLNSLLMLYLNSGNYNARRLILDILEKYDYNPNNELLRLVQITDLYFLNYLKDYEYSNSVGGLTTCKGIIKSKSDVVEIRSNHGIVKLNKLDEYLGTSPIKEEQRQGFCHNLTSLVISNDSSLYGAYYYIPLAFKGSIEHSVVINMKDKEVWDFANNIIVPLSIWKRFLGSPSLLIDGAYYQNLCNKVYDKEGINLNICMMEEIRRKRIK